MDVAFDRVSSHPVVTTVACILFYSLFIRLVTPAAVPKNLPWVGKRSKAWLSQTWACLMSIRHVPEWMGEGYQKV